MTTNFGVIVCILSGLVVQAGPQLKPIFLILADQHIFLREGGLFNCLPGVLRRLVSVLSASIFCVTHFSEGCFSSVLTPW